MQRSNNNNIIDKIQIEKTDKNIYWSARQIAKQNSVEIGDNNNIDTTINETISNDIGTENSSYSRQNSGGLRQRSHGKHKKQHKS